MNNLEKEIQDKTAEEIYDFLWFLFHDYGCSFTDSRKAIIEWINGEREMNYLLYDYKFGDVQTDKDLIHLQKEQAYMQGYEDGRKSRTGVWVDYSSEGFVECPFCHNATNCEDNKDELHYCFSCGAELR